MRSRNIKPGLYKNDQLAELSIWARYLFPGLWMLADREGRLEDRPGKIKGEIFPYDDLSKENIEELLDELETSPEQFIQRYEVEGKKFIQITNFSQHQNIHRNEKESKLPPPPQHEENEHTPEPSAGETFTKTPVITGQVRGKEEARPAESLNLRISESHEITPYPPKGEPLGAAFENLWKEYPRKVDKKKALEQLKRIKPDTDLLATMEAAIKAWKKSESWTRDGGKYVPHMHRWLRDKRWEDALPEPVTSSVHVDRKKFAGGVVNDW